MTTKPKSSIALAPPAIDRRALFCALGTAAIAGVPALASTAPDDSVFQALAALEQLKIHAEESGMSKSWPRRPPRLA